MDHSQLKQTRCIQTCTAVCTQYRAEYLKPLKTMSDKNQYDSDRLYAPIRARKTADNVSQYRDRLVE